MADMTPERIHGEWPPKWTVKSVVGTVAGFICAVLVGAAAAYVVSLGFREAVSMAVAAIRGK